MAKHRSEKKPIMNQGGVHKVLCCSLCLLEIWFDATRFVKATNERVEETRYYDSRKGSLASAESNVGVLRNGKVSCLGTRGGPKCAERA